MKTRFLILLICFALACTSARIPEEVKTDKVRNVILLIGDGMGLSQVSSSFYFDNPNEPNFARFPFIGLIRTSSAKEKVTDSASGATAFSCGEKTYNGAIAVDVDGKPIETLVERVADKEVNTGLIATSSITHATPASFIAHVSYRKEADSIAAQLVNSSIDFIAGGGIKFFNQREDGQQLLATLDENGFDWDTSGLKTFDELRLDRKQAFLLAEDGLPSKLEGRGDFLPNSTRLALNYLHEKDEPFFLMVEGSQIDWEGHNSNVKGVVQEVRDFDKAIGIALDYAEEQGNTLVVVCADHETGGFALRPPMIRNQYKYEHIEGGFYEGSTKLPSAAHTATLIPVFSYGPGAEKFGGIYENTGIFHKIIEATGW